MLMVHKQGCGVPELAHPDVQGHDGHHLQQGRDLWWGMRAMGG